jgi:hypothetical protein
MHECTDGNENGSEHAIPQQLFFNQQSCGQSPTEKS